MRMTWRERLADWISGGKLTRARDRATELKERRDYWADQYMSSMHRSLPDARRSGIRMVALRDIAAMETAGANGTVKRMARRAREALE